jgi:hypothetical protein
MHMLPHRIWANPISGLAAFFCSGAVAATYNSIYIAEYQCSGSDIKYSTDAVVRLTSYFVPIVSRVYSVVLNHTGDVCRGVLAQNVYAVDWIVGLVGLIAALPSLRAVAGATLDGVRGKLNLRTSPNAQKGLRIWLRIIIVGAIVSVEEAWVGSFGNQGTLYVNNVASRNSDLYRLCIFVPLALLFSSLSVIFLYAWARWRKEG